MSNLALAQLPDWPAAMNREAALAYMGVADVQLKMLELQGLVRFCARGPRGEKIALRRDLDAALRSLFDARAVDEDPIDF